MKVCVLRGGRLVLLDNEPWPTPKAGQLLIRVFGAACIPADPQLRALLALDSTRATSERGEPVGQCLCGEITQLGPKAETLLAVGDVVLAVLPADHDNSALAEYCTAPVWSVVKVPAGVDRMHAAALGIPSLLAYSALQYGGRIAAGDSILVCNGASALGHAVVQLASIWGGKVTATASTIAEAMYLKSLSAVSHVLDLSDRTVQFAEQCEEITGGLGFDIVLNTAGLGEHNDIQRLQPSKEDLLAVLAPLGTWATTTSNLDLRPEEVRCLSLKGAAVRFLSLAAWTMASSQQGRLLNILADALDWMAKGQLKANIAEVLSFDGVASKFGSEVPVGVHVLKAG